MKAFQVKGDFVMGAQKKKFKKEIVGNDAENAMEMVYSILGSKHNVKRSKITIESIVEIPKDAIEDPIVRHKVGGLNE
jgi:large subunit ribosomal protein LX